MYVRTHLYALPHRHTYVQAVQIHKHTQDMYVQIHTKKTQKLKPELVIFHIDTCVYTYVRTPSIASSGYMNKYTNHIRMVHIIS